MINLQWDSLRRIREAKEFSKVVKPDDTKVTVYLWNEGIDGIASEDESNTTLHGFCTMGWRFLSDDCVGTVMLYLF